MNPIRLPIFYSQYDPQWAKKLLGFNTDSKYDFYNYACLLSCLASIAKYFGKDETPLTLNDKLKGVSGFVENSGKYVWGSLPKVYPDITETLTRTPQPLTDAQIEEIKQALDARLPVMVNLDYNPKTVAVDDHYVVLLSYNKDDENDFLIYDPLGGVTRSLKSYLGWFTPSVRKTIQKYLIFSGPMQAVPEVVPVVEVAEIKPVESPAAENSTSTLPENYGDIIKKSGQFDELVKKFAPEVLPENIDAAALENRIRQQLPVEIKEVEKEKIVEVIKEVPVEKIVEKLVEVPAGDATHAAIQWKEVVSYLELGKLPDEAVFEDAKKVIAGYKSAQTDYKNKANDALKLTASKDITIANQERVIGNLKKQVTLTEKLRRAEVDNLIKNMPNFNKLKVQFEGAMRELQADVDRGIGEINSLSLKLSDKEIEASNVVDSQGVKEVSSGPFTKTTTGVLSAVGGFLQFIKKYLSLKES